MVVVDAAVKRAPVELLECGPVSPGKYLVLFAGGVAEVDEALRAGALAAGDSLLDQLYLAQVHLELLPALRAGAAGLSVPGASVGIVELHTVASALRAADAACKSAEVHLQLLHAARGIGGKAWFILRGALHDVEVAVEAATQAAGDGLLAGAEIIAAPHADLHGHAI